MLSKLIKKIKAFKMYNLYKRQPVEDQKAFLEITLLDYGCPVIYSDT